MDLAIKDYTKTTELEPDNAIAYYNRGNAYFVKDEVDLAIKDYTKAIEIKPNGAGAYNNRGANLWSKRRF